MTQRHPLQLALPFYVSGYTIQKGNGALRLVREGMALPLAWERVHPLLGLAPGDARGSDALFGLLRFDAGIWSLQPLALRGVSGKKGRRKTILSGETGAAVLQEPPKHNAVSTLQERAGRLLRAG